MIKRFLLSSCFGLCVISFGQVTYGGATYDNNHTISFTVSSDSGAVGVQAGTSGLQGNDRVNGNVAIGNNGDSISSSATLSGNNDAKIGMHAYAGKTVENTNDEGIFYEGEVNANIYIPNANTASVSAYASKQNDKYTSSVNGQLTSENGNGEIVASSWSYDKSSDFVYADQNTFNGIDTSNANTASVSAYASKQNDKYTSSVNGQLTSENGNGEIWANSYGDVDGWSSAYFDLSNANTASVNMYSTSYGNEANTTIKSNIFNEQGNGYISSTMHALGDYYHNDLSMTAHNVNSASTNGFSNVAPTVNKVTLNAQGQAGGVRVDTDDTYTPEINCQAFGEFNISAEYSKNHEPEIKDCSACD